MNAGLAIVSNVPVIKYKSSMIDDEVLEAIDNIKATLTIEKRKGNPNADFILRRMR